MVTHFIRAAILSGLVSSSSSSPSSFSISPSQFIAVQPTTHNNYYTCSSSSSISNFGTTWIFNYWGCWVSHDVSDGNTCKQKKVIWVCRNFFSRWSLLMLESNRWFGSMLLAPSIYRESTRQGIGMHCSKSRTHADNNRLIYHCDWSWSWSESTTKNPLLFISLLYFLFSYSFWGLSLGLCISSSPLFG